MKKFSLICSALVMVLVFTLCGLFSVMAETTPVEVTQPATTPQVTTPVTQPVTGDTQPGTDYVEPTGTTGNIEPATVYTEPTTVIRPTEYIEEPNTYSSYVNPAPPYTPAEQDFEKNDFEELDEAEIMALVGGSVEGIQDFNNIKKNNTKGDERSYFLLILGIVLIFLAIAGFTFVFLYRPDKKGKKTVPAYAAASDKYTSKGGAHSKKSRTAERRDSRSRDDYNDGF